MKSIYIILISLILLSNSSLAGQDRGGGNAVGNELLDFYENSGTTQIIFTETREYKEIIQPLFEQLDSKLPGLSQKLMEAAHQRIWLIDPKPLEDESKCINSSIIRVEKQVVACQNSFDVRLKKQWMESPAVSLENKAGLLVHELGRFQALKPNSRISDVGLHAVVRAIFNSNIGIGELQLIVEQAGFGLYPSIFDYARAKITVKSEVLPMCQNSSTKPYEIFERVLFMKDRNYIPRGQVIVFYNMAQQINNLSGGVAIGNTFESYTPRVCQALNEVIK